MVPHDAERHPGVGLHVVEFPRRMFSCIVMKMKQAYCGMSLRTVIALLFFSQYLASYYIFILSFWKFEIFCEADSETLTSDIR